LNGFLLHAQSGRPVRRWRVVLMACRPLISRISEELNVIDLVEAILDVRRRPRRHKIRPPERVDRDQDDVAGASAVAREAAEQCQSRIAHIAAVQ